MSSIWRLPATKESSTSGSYQEPQVLDTVPSLCDESNDLISHSCIILKQGCPSTSNLRMRIFLDFTDCTPVADVYVKWLTWLDDWEMHRDDNVPLRSWVPALEVGFGKVRAALASKAFGQWDAI
ncbi:hypothetical protein TNCV_4026371 [Trichonephila clavipes]|nr:hypothetical protein TNCV_4026371 [Trichonephila clavipes]